MILSRRKLIGGIGLVFAAPAIVKASSLMKVKALPDMPISSCWLYKVRRYNVIATIIPHSSSNITAMMRDVYHYHPTAAEESAAPYSSV